MSDYRVAIITDTTCDIPRDLIKKYNIHMVPQYVIWRNEVYNDLTEMDAPTFYHRLPRDSEMPKTSRPTVPDYLDLVKKAMNEGAEEVAVILVSEKVSGSVPSAHVAKPESPIPFHIYDSGATSMGLGWQVLAAARAREEGADTAEALIEVAKKVRQTLKINFTVDTLEYLHKNGRIGGAAALIGTALQLKPSLYMDPETGTIMPGEKTRTRRKALKAIYDEFFKDMDPARRLHVAVAHGAALEEAEELIEKIKTHQNPVETILTHLSPAIGVHAGPGGICITGYTEQ